jgi:DNA-binding transcriptional LysR family regulator
MDPKIQQLRAFYYAYRMRSLTKAGERLHLTQSAMSRLTQQLEEALGQRLFDRTTGALQSTEAAEEAILIVERILTDVDFLKTSLKGLAEKRRGNVKFAITPSLAAQAMPEALVDFQATWGNIDVEMLDAAPDRVVELVLDEVAQFGIVTVGEKRSDLDYQLLVDDVLCVVCRRDSALAKKKRVTWDDLQDANVIATVGGASWPEVVREILASRETPTSIRHRVAFPTTALALAAKSLGVAILPSRLTLGCPKEHQLIARKLHDPVVPRGIHVVTKVRRSISPAGLALIEMFRTVLGDVAAK